MTAAMLSAQVCLMEKRTNRHKAANANVQLAERMVTYEGSEFLSSPTPFNGARHCALSTCTLLTLNPLLPAWLAL